MAQTRPLPAALQVATLGRIATRVVSLNGFRTVAVACEAATVLITWPLWQVHRSPPMLPALPLPAVDLGVALLLTLVIVLVRPLLGVALHSIALLYAMLIDQTRIQPEVVSLTVLIWATLPYAGALALGRAHLVSLWAWAGLNKLLSPGFMHETAQWMLSGLWPGAPGMLRENFGYIVAFGELGTGVLAFVPRTRPIAAVAALLLHAGILLDLSPLGHHWNEAIWPWNVTLALAGFALIAPWRGSPVRALLGAPRWLRPVLVAVVVAPLGFYAGVTDAYLAHNLYSSNTPTTLWCDSSGACRASVETLATFDAFNVPVPPEHRLLDAYFAKTCRPGEWMIVRDTRHWASVGGKSERSVLCTATDRPGATGPKRSGLPM